MASDTDQGRAITRANMAILTAQAALRALITRAPGVADGAPEIMTAALALTAITAELGDRDTLRLYAEAQADQAERALTRAAADMQSAAMGAPFRAARAAYLGAAEADVRMRAIMGRPDRYGDPEADAYREARAESLTLT
jgi:hypothetical protein